MHPRQPTIMFILLLLSAATVSAGQAYTWTDSAGVTHFSESLPADAAAQAERVDLPPAPVTPALPPERYRSINSQAARLQADRLKREQLREKRRQIEMNRQQERAQPEHDEQDYTSNHYYYYPNPYGYRPYQRRHRPHHRDDPRRYQYPPPRPRFQPGKTITQQRNQEALRNHHYRW